MIDIGGFGTKIQIVAIQTFPLGFEVSEFADDIEPISITPIELIGFKRLYDGDIFFHKKNTPVEIEISVTPNSSSDINMKILLQTAGLNKKFSPVRDILTMVVGYGDGGKVVFSKGSIVSGPPADSITADKRKSSNTYKFVFGTWDGAQSISQVMTGILDGITT